MTNDLYTHEPVSRTYYSQRLRLHYVEWINKDAPPLIMVHGGSDHCRNWDWAARVLNKHFNIIAPDLRGHGDSGWSNTTYRKLDFVYDLKQLIKLNGYKKVSIIAHSFGGWVSLLYAGLNPEMVDKLVVIEGLLPMSPKHRLRLEYPRHERLNIWMNLLSEVSTFTDRRMPSFKAAQERLHAANTKLTNEQARHLTKYAVKMNEDGTYSWKYDAYIRSLNDSPELLESEVMDIRSRIECPMLLLQGEESPFILEHDSKYIQTLKDCKVVNFPNASHWLQHEKLDRFLEEVTAFLSD